MARSLRIRRVGVLLASACALLRASPGAAQELVDAGTSPTARALVRLQYEPVEPPRLVALLLTRLRAELNVAGFSVASSAPAAADGAGTSTSSGAGGYASISLSARGEQSVKLEITSRSLAASSHVVLVGGERDVAALALQATEFLRAGLVPRLAAGTAQASPAAPIADASAPAQRDQRSGRLLLDVGATLLSNFRAGDRLALLSLGAGYAWPERAALRGVIDLPLGGASFETAAGVTDYRMYQAGLEADYAWLRWSGGEATLGLCAGIAKVTTTGRSASPLESRSPESWALALGGRAEAEQRLSAIVAVTASVRVLGLSPNPVVAILADERRLGSPALLFQLGARVGGR